MSEEPASSSPRLTTADADALSLSLFTPAVELMDSGYYKVTLSWSCSESASCEVRVDGETYAIGNATQLVLELAEGEHSYAVRATASSGASSGWVEGETLLVGVVESEPTVSDFAAVVEEGVVSLSWSAHATAASYELRYCVGSSGEWVTLQAAQPEMTLPDLPAGTYTCELRVTDAAGSAGEWMLAGTFTVLSGAPVLTLHTAVVGELNEGYCKVTFSWSCSESASCEVRVDGVVYAVGSAMQLVLELAEGEHSYAVRSTSAAGTSSEWVEGEPLLIDFSAPELPIPTKDAQVEGSTATLCWESAGDASTVSYELRYRAGESGEWTQVETAQTSLVLSGLAAGSYTCELRARDAAGNTSDWVPVGSFIIAAEAPELTLHEPLTEKSGEASVKVTFSWSCSVSAEYELVINGVVCYSGSGERVEVELPEGHYSYAVTATDATGMRVTQAGRDLLFDATPPVLTLQEPVLEKTAEGLTRVSLSWASSEDADFVLVVDGERVAREASGANSHVLELADGVHTYSVTAQDASGNQITEEGNHIVLDATAPVLTLADPTWEALGNGFTRVTLRWECVDTSATTCTVMASGRQVYSGTESGCEFLLADGEHSYSVTAMDAYGNSTTAYGEPFTLDTLAPAFELLEPQVTKLSEGQVSVTLQWSGEVGAYYVVTLAGRGTPLYEGADTSCTFTHADGDYQYRITATDAAGNASTLYGSFSFDVTAPVLTLADPEVQKSEYGLSKVTFSWAANEAATYELRVDGELAYTGSATLHELELPDGEHSYSVTATDAYGNSTTAYGELFTLDTLAPVVELLEPQVTKLSEGQVSVTLQWSGEVGAYYVVTLEGSGTPLYEGADTSCTFTHVDGEHQYRITATDAAGNASTLYGSFSGDATAPVLTLADPEVQKSESGLSKVIFIWAANEVSRYELWVDGELAYTGSATSHELELADGEHSYSVTATDAYGNSTTAYGEPFSLDTLAPAFELLEPQVVKVAEGQVSVTLHWSGETGVRYTVWLEGEDSPIYEGTGISCTFTHADGDYQYRITATDAAGNASSLYGTFSFDATAPVLTLADPEVQKSESGLSKVIFSWAANEASRYELWVDGELAYTGSATRHELELVDGEHSCLVTATDGAGNSTTAYAEPFSLDTLAPVFELLEPQVTKLSEGQVSVTLHWSGEPGARYIVWLEGEESPVYEGTGTSCTFTHVDGDYQYRIAATDAAGNASTLYGSFGGDATAPVLTLSEPVVQKTGAGLSKVIFRWAANEAATYELWVDGALAYTGNGTSHELELPDGEHSYAVRATDAAGLSTTVEGEPFSLDASAPGLRLNTPELYPLGEGITRVCFSWVSDESATYELWVDGELVYTGSSTSHELELVDGEHSCLVTATDGAGNATTVAGEPIMLDTLAPVFELLEPQVTKLAEGQVSVTLHWSGEVGSHYTVWREGEDSPIYEGTGISCTFTHADGEYQYRITATDATGNASTLHGSFGCDATAPVPNLLAPVLLKTASGITMVTFIWSAPEAASYELLVNGDIVYAGTDTRMELYLPDGEYHYVLHATDASGNAAQVEGHLLLDATAAFELLEPQVTKLSEGQVSVTLQWTGEPGARYTVWLEEDDSPIYEGTDTSCTFAHADGGYQYRITATDAAGNAAALEGSFSYDASAPVLTLAEPVVQKSASGLSTVILSWAANEAARYELWVDGELVYTGSSTSYELELADGEHHYSLVATDKNGNRCEEQGTNLLIDSVAPTVSALVRSVESLGGVDDTGSSGAAGSVGAACLRVSFEVECDDPEAAIRVEINGQSHSLTADGTLELAPSVNGRYDYKVIATDKAGNSSAAGGCFFHEASGPELRLLDPTLGKGSRGRVKVTLSWVGEEGSLTTLVVDGKTVLNNKKKKTNWKGTLKDGEHNYSLTVTDAEGQATTLHYKFSTDGTAPTLTEGALSTEKLAEGSGRVTLNWASNEAATYTVTVDKKVLYTGADDSCTLDLADGKHNYIITGVDASGNVSKALKGKFTVDTTAPALILKAAKLKKMKQEGSATVTLSWKGESKATYAIVVDGQEVATSKKTSYKLTLADGAHSYSIVATDLAGNSVEQSGSIAVDTTSPDLSGLGLELSQSADGLFSSTFTWEPESGTTYELKVDGKKYKNLSGTSYTLTGLKSGKHKYELTAVDAAGNKSVSKSNFICDASLLPSSVSLDHELALSSGDTLPTSCTCAGLTGCTSTLCSYLELETAAAQETKTSLLALHA